MDYSANDYGRWEHDEHGMPCFRLTATDEMAPYSPLKHLVATGRLSAFLDRWGNVALFTTDGGTGYVDITRNAHQCRSALYSMVRVGGELVSLIHGELAGERSVVYRAGGAEYCGEYRAPRRGLHLRVEQRFAAVPDGSPFLLGRFDLHNQGEEPLELEWIVASDLSLIDNYKARGMPPHEVGDGFAQLKNVHEGLGDFYLLGPEDWQGTMPSKVAAGLVQKVVIDPHESIGAVFAVGYGKQQDMCCARASVHDAAVADAAAAWAECLEVVQPRGVQDWMRDECRWDIGQLLSFINYDSSLGELYVSLGGYGWRGFNQRELGEDAIALLPWYAGFARSCLHFMARTQYTNGDLPKSHNFTDVGTEAPPPETIGSSDTELWFLLGCAELSLLHPEVMDEAVPYRDADEAPLWDHCRRAFRWVRDAIGRGRHGLVKSWHGDWNDYLFPMGAAGEGESMMNTGMAARACHLLAGLARERGDGEFCAELEQFREALREAAGESFTGTHFVRGYTDEGRPVGGSQSGRVFLNAQSWPALGGCGTQKQRRTALATALRECSTSRGLCLVSRPFPSPPPADVSSLPIPAGEGENGGVWPQAVAWMIWALAEQGMTDEAMTTWQRSTLRHNAALHPDVPFGLFNGPDCYNSHHAGDLAHWTQVQLWDRRVHTPMNPAIAWQAMGLQRILTAEEAAR